jgi:hypothetical protein
MERLSRWQFVRESMAINAKLYSRKTGVYEFAKKMKAETPMP